MSRNPNIGFPPPPVQTPLTADVADLHGIPFQQRDGNPLNNLATPWSSWFTAVYQRVAASPTIFDTAANMKATAGNAVNYPPEKNLGIYFYQTDTGYTYQSRLVANVPTWVYVFGERPLLQANIPAAATLGVNDTYLVVDVTDFNHRLQWSGTAWGWAPGENGSGFIDAFLVDPTGNGWAICDGSSKTYLKSDGTLGTATLPNLVGLSAYLKLGASASSVTNAPIAPIFTGTAVASANLTTGAASGSVSAGSTGTTVSAASPSHTHSVTVPYPTPAGTNSTTGEPANVILRPFFRR